MSVYNKRDRLSRFDPNLPNPAANGIRGLWCFSAPGRGATESGICTTGNALLPGVPHQHSRDKRRAGLGERQGQSEAGGVRSVPSKNMGRTAGRSREQPVRHHHQGERKPQHAAKPESSLLLMDVTLVIQLQGQYYSQIQYMIQGCPSGRPRKGRG